MYNLEWRQSVKWLSWNRLPNTRAIQSDGRFTDFLGVDFKELFKTASVLALRWWLQFRSFIGSASCKKLKLLLYCHGYPSCLRVVVEQLQATVMVYSSMESRIGCSMKMASDTLPCLCFSHQAKVNHVYVSLSLFPCCYPPAVCNKKLPQPHSHLQSNWLHYSVTEIWASVKDAQSWAGCTLPSNHRLVTVDLLAPKQHGFRQSNTNKLTIHTDNLIHYRDLQEFAVAVALMLPTCLWRNPVGMNLE